MLTLKNISDNINIGWENPNWEEVKKLKRNYDYSKLRGRIIEKLGSIKKYAELLEISDTALSNKLNNKVPFNQDEIYKSIKKDVLDIDSLEIYIYFFKEKVGENTINNEV